MGVDVREFRTEDAPEVRRLRFRTFSANTFEPDDDERYVDDDRRVVAELDGRIVGHAGAWRFGQFFGGRRVPMAAVAAVLVEPHARGKGVASRMVRLLLERVRADGDAIATLYPATVVPYRRLGWEFAGVRPAHLVRTRSLLGVPAPTAHVDLRPGTPDDVAAMHHRYVEAARTHDGWFDLDPRYHGYMIGDVDDRGADEWWVAERDDGLTGYARYTRSADGGRNRLDVHELVGSDVDTERALWRLLGGSWTVWPEARVRGPVDPTLVHLLPEEDLRIGGSGSPRDRWSRWMTRVIDVAAAIEARGYPGVEDAEVHLEIRDDMLADVDGRWVVRITDGVGSAEPGGRGTVRTDVGAFSAMYAGATSASAWRRLERLHSDDEQAVATLDTVFRGPTPTALQYF